MASHTTPIEPDELNYSLAVEDKYAENKMDPSLDSYKPAVQFLDVKPRDFLRSTHSPRFVLSLKVRGHELRKLPAQEH